MKKIPIIPMYPRFNLRNSFSKIFEKTIPYPIEDEINTSMYSKNIKCSVIKEFN